MPKNAKKKKNNKNSRGDPAAARKIIEKEPGQEYACIIKRLGGPTLSVKCCDGTLRLAKIRGSMMKRCWMKDGDWILVSLREYGEKVDVIHKYNDDEVRYLRKAGEIFETRTKHDDDLTIVEEENEDAFTFEEI